MKDIKNTILQKFREVYGEGEAHAFFAPGRVNLIGEHTDYNGGHVFPCALTIGTYAVARKRNDRNVHTIYDIALLVKEEFGEDAEPLYDRLLAYFRTLQGHGFVTLTPSDKDTKREASK